MPYYIYTSKQLIVLSNDFKSVILYNNENILNLYKDIFLKSLEQTSGLIYNFSDCSNYISTYLKAYQDFGEVISVIEPQPCLAKYYTHQMVDKHLRPEVQNWNIIKQKIYDYYDNCKTIFPSIKCFFSIDGLDYFVNTGVMKDLPSQFAYPFTVSERRYLLNLLISDIQNNDILYRIINPFKLQISSFTSIQSYKNKGMVFTATDENIIISCNINEQSICDAFDDFINSLPESELVYNKEDTIKVLENAIKQLDNQE
jgi:hypothetical protein